MISRLQKPPSCRVADAGLVSILLAACGTSGSPIQADTGVGGPTSDAAPAGPCETEGAGPNDDIVSVQGQRIKIVDFNLYVCRDGKWVFEKTLLRENVKDIRFRKSNGTCEAVNTKTGERGPIPNVRRYSSGFEVSSFIDLFRVDGWSTTTLLSPKADTVEKYIALHRQLLMGGSFLDNRIDVQSANVRSGGAALRFYAVAPATDQITSKSLIQKDDFCFAKGEHLWFSAWYYVEQGPPATLVDFEFRLLDAGGGIRLFLRNQQYATMELKFGPKPQYSQNQVPLPQRKWVNIKIHLTLDNREGGVVEMWQDGAKILTTMGQTLPTHDSIYNSLQVGITATPREAVLFLDDVVISDQPL